MPEATIRLCEQADVLIELAAQADLRALDEQLTFYALRAPIAGRLSIVQAIPGQTLTPKGRQTRHAIEQAARKLFAERGFHGTTLADITSAAGKSTAVFYRYYTDKEDLLAALAESFLRDIVTPSGLSLRLPDSPDGWAATCGTSSGPMSGGA